MKFTKLGNENRKDIIELGKYDSLQIFLYTFQNNRTIVLKKSMFMFTMHNNVTKFN